MDATARVTQLRVLALLGEGNVLANFDNKSLKTCPKKFRRPTEEILRRSVVGAYRPNGQCLQQQPGSQS